MKRLLVLIILGISIGLYNPLQVQADLVNFGVDIHTDGTYSQVPGGFIGDDTGHTIYGDGDHITFTIVTTFPAGSVITDAELFIDATDVGNDDGSYWEFRVRGDQDPGSWISLGSLQDTSHANTFVPVLAGPFGTHVQTPFSNDVDNTFFIIPSSLFGTILNSDLDIMIDVRSYGWDDARIDGANLQVAYNRVPEPFALLFLGAGLLGLGVFARRK